MGEAVDAPHDVDSAGISEDRGDHEGVQEGLVPEVHWYHSWEHEAQYWHHLHVVSENG